MKKFYIPILSLGLMCATFGSCVDVELKDTLDYEDTYTDSNDADKHILDIYSLFMDLAEQMTQIRKVSIHEMTEYLKKRNLEPREERSIAAILRMGSESMGFVSVFWRSMLLPRAEVVAWLTAATAAAREAKWRGAEVSSTTAITG